MKPWEIIVDNLSKAGWSWGCVSAIDREGRTIWIVDAHCDDGRRFIVRADEKLTAFLDLEYAERALQSRSSRISLIACFGRFTRFSSHARQDRMLLGQALRQRARE
jgi:hypothetical protein